MEANTISKEHLKIDAVIAESVKTYIKCAEELDILTLEVKELKSKKTQHEDIIKKFMEDSNIQTFSVGDKITFTMSTSKRNTKKVNKESISTVLKQKQISQYVIDNVIEDLYSKNPENIEEIVKVKVDRK